MATFYVADSVTNYAPSATNFEIYKNCKSNTPTINTNTLYGKGSGIASRCAYKGIMCKSVEYVLLPLLLFI